MFRFLISPRLGLNPRKSLVSLEVFDHLNSNISNIKLNYVIVVSTDRVTWGNVA